MCGEHGAPVFRPPVSTGSSPHVRGAHRLHWLLAVLTGIIPACAGSTGRWRDEKRNVRDHPRMCGEHEAWSPQHTMQAGSSPHVRGARDLIAIPSAVVGIIPACAGSTIPLRQPNRVIRDHPRMCGEHDNTQRHRRTDRGSSPHVRGSTKRHQWCWLICRDHPRMCGEHQIVAWNAGSTQGSSPHVRGALSLRLALRGRTGIIPACAGSTSYSYIRSSSARDHPRMCGEHDVCDSGLAVNQGSSPHVRGALLCAELGLRVGGIIPACAGSTQYSTTCR